MLEWLLEGDADPLAQDADSGKQESDGEKQQQLKLQRGKGGDKTITTVPELIKHMRNATKDKMKPIEFKLCFINSRRLERFGFVSEPEDPADVLWERKYKRRIIALNSGRLTLYYKPFACLGDIETDAIKLFLDAYKAYIDEIPKFSYNFSQSIQRFVPTIVLDPDRRKTLAVGPFLGQICEFRKREAVCRGGGKKLLKSALLELRRRISSVQCGLEYKTHVLRCLAERDFLEKLLAGYFKDDRTMEIKPLPETAFVPVAEFIEVKTRHEDVPRMTSQRSSAAANMPANSFINFKNLKNIRTFRDRLMYVYIFLCSLHNIRTKQLKTKQFLPIPVQRSLRRDPFMRKQEDSRFYKTQAAAKTASSDTITTNSPRESARQSVAFGLPAFKRGFPLTRDRSVESRLRILQKEPSLRVETWEDLLTIGTKPRQLKAIRQKVLPPWQMKWSAEDDLISSKQRRDVARPPVITPDMHRKLSRVAEGEDEHVTTYHPKDALMRMRLGMLKANERSKKNLSNQLNKLDRERMTQYSYKSQVFDHLPKFWEHCRTALDRSSEQARRDPSNIKEHVEPWFQALKDACTYGQVREEPLVEDYLRKIERFLLLDEITAIPSVLEKFCLIVVSMPIYEILQAHVQWAVSFVLCEILEGKQSMLVEWLNYRRLYVIDQQYGAAIASANQLKD